jgi:hypothetical protein
MRGHLQRLYDRAAALSSVPGVAGLRPALVSSSPIAEADRRLDNPDLAFADLAGLMPPIQYGETPIPAESGPAPLAPPRRNPLQPAAAAAQSPGAPPPEGGQVAAPPQPRPAPAAGPRSDSDIPPEPEVSERRAPERSAVPPVGTQAATLRQHLNGAEESRASVPPWRPVGDVAERVAPAPPERLAPRPLATEQPAPKAGERARFVPPLMQPAAAQDAPIAETTPRPIEAPPAAAPLPRSTAAEQRAPPPAPAEAPPGSAVPTRPATAAGASRIGPLAPRRRAHLVFGLRRR